MVGGRFCRRYIIDLAVVVVWSPVVVVEATVDQVWLCQKRRRAREQIQKRWAFLTTAGAHDDPSSVLPLTPKRERISVWGAPELVDERASSIHKPSRC